VPVITFLTGIRGISSGGVAYAIQPISLALSLAALHARPRNCGKLILRLSSGTLDAEKELAMSLLSSDLV